MKSYNRAIIIGNLSADPDIKKTEKGQTIAKFCVVTNRNTKTKDGLKLERADFHKVVAWSKLAEICADYLRKGMAVMVEGRIHNNSFKNSEGKIIVNTEIEAESINFINFKRSAKTGALPETEEIKLIEV